MFCHEVDISGSDQLTTRTTHDVELVIIKYPSKNRPVLVRFCTQCETSLREDARKGQAESKGENGSNGHGSAVSLVVDQVEGGTLPLELK